MRRHQGPEILRELGHEYHQKTSEGSGVGYGGEWRRMEGNGGGGGESREGKGKRVMKREETNKERANERRIRVRAQY